MTYKLLPEFVLSKDPLYGEGLYPVNYGPNITKAVLQDTLSRYFFYPNSAPVGSLFNKILSNPYGIMITRDLGSLPMTLIVSEKIGEIHSAKRCQDILADETCELLAKEISEAMSSESTTDLFRIGWSDMPRTASGRWADIVLKPNWANQRGVWSYITTEIKDELIRMRTFIPSSLKVSRQIVAARNGSGGLGAWMVTAQDGMNILMNGLLRPIKFGLSEEGLYPYINETKRRNPVDEIYCSRLIDGLLGAASSGSMVNYPRESHFYSFIIQSRYFNPANFGLNEKGEVVDKAPIQWFGDSAGLQELWEIHIAKFSEFMKDGVRKKGIKEYKNSLNETASLLSLLEGLAPGCSNWAKREQEKETFVKVYMGKIRSVVKTVKTEMTDAEINSRLTRMIPNDADREFTIMSKNPISLRKYLLTNKFFEDSPALKSVSPKPGETSDVPELVEVSKAFPTLQTIHDSEADQAAAVRRQRTSKVRDAAGNIHTITTL